VSLGGGRSKRRDVSRAVAARREEERLHHHLRRAPRDAARHGLREVGRRQLEVRDLDRCPRQALAQEGGDPLDDRVGLREPAPVVDQHDGATAHQ
jgi:hypothetical protein